MSQTFGSKLRELRSGKGWTQDELAQRCGVPLWTLRGYEQDYRAPSWRNFLDLCKALEVNPLVFDACDPDAEPAPAPRGKPKKGQARP